jgi:hypothetical protein
MLRISSSGCVFAFLALCGGALAVLGDGRQEQNDPATPFFTHVDPESLPTELAAQALRGTTNGPEHFSDLRESAPGPFFGCCVIWSENEPDPLLAHVFCLSRNWKNAPFGLA